MAKKWRSTRTGFVLCMHKNRRVGVNEFWQMQFDPLGTLPCKQVVDDWVEDDRSAGDFFFFPKSES